MKDPFRYLDNKKRASMELILIAEDEQILQNLYDSISKYLSQLSGGLGEIVIANYEVMDNE
jgi:hypothetical protein